MALRTVLDLVVRMREIMNQWHPSTRPGNDGDAGNTLEDLLGVEENNFQLPDFGEVELKTKKTEGGSLLTLFHRDPYPRPSVPKLILAMGWRHSEAGGKYPNDEMSFRSTTYGHRYSDRGFSIIVDHARIYFVYEPLRVARATEDRTGVYPTYGDWADDIEARTNPSYRECMPVHYDLNMIQRGFVNKLSHTLLAFRRTRQRGGRREYYYHEAYLMRDLQFESIGALVREGSIAIDFDARTRHNHGTKFRIAKSRLGLLFNEFEQISPDDEVVQATIV